MKNQENPLIWMEQRTLCNFFLLHLFLLLFYMISTGLFWLGFIMNRGEHSRKCDLLHLFQCYIAKTQTEKALLAPVKVDYTLTHAACLLSCFNCLWISVTLWTVVCQAPLSMGFPRQEYWSRWPCPPPLDLPDPGIELASNRFTLIGFNNNI